MAKEKRTAVTRAAPRGIMPPAISTWEDADRVLAGVAECRQALARIKADLEGRIDTAKAVAKEYSAEYAAREAAALAALEAFTRAHESDLEGRSQALLHGRIGLRRATRIVLKRTVKFVLDALHARGWNDCVRIREEVDKEVLDHYTDDDLKKIGCARVTEDLFFAETDEVRL